MCPLPTYLGIDLGTSSVKGVLIEADGRTIATAERPLALATPSPLAAEQDADAWWAATVEVLRELTAADDRTRIGAVGFAGQKHAFLPLDASDRPLCPAVLWCDGRAAPEADELHARVDRVTLGRRTGAFASPGYLLPKWLRFRRKHPELAARTTSLLFAKDWLRFRMTGVKATDRTEASASLLFDIGRKAWAEDLAAMFEVPLTALPTVLRSSDVAGRVTEAAALETGVPARTPVVGGAGDNEAGALACGALGEGVVAVILGTSATIVAAHESRGTAGGLAWGRHATRSGYAATGVVLSAGRALEWIREAVFAPGVTTEAVIAAAAASDASEGALVFVPSLVGERSPVPDAGASGAFLGLRPGHGRGHLARAVLEGVALSIAEVLHLIRGAGVPVTDLRLTSGGAASPFWRGLVAAAANLPVRAMGDVHGPALGAAILAARGAGRFKTLKDAVDAWVAPSLVTERCAVEAPDLAEVTRLSGLGTSLRSMRNALRATSMPRRSPRAASEGSSRA